MSNNIRNSTGYNNANRYNNVRKKPAQPQNKVDANEVMRITVILTMICVIITALLAGTNMLTADKIAQNSLAAKQDAWREVLPAEAYVPLALPSADTVSSGDAVSASDAVAVVDPALENLDAAVCVSGTDVGGVVITTKDKGYGGEITVLTGFDKRGNITGVRLLEHSETAGLGANAEKSKFIDQYITPDGESRPGSFAVSKDGGTIDAVTAATISSRAVTRAVNKAVAVYDALNRNGMLVIPESYFAENGIALPSATDAAPVENTEEKDGGENDGE